jgi:hypothetical protein
MERVCDREINLITFIEKQKIDLGSDFAYENFFTRQTDESELIELRNYVEGDVMPAFHSGYCELPNIVKNPDRSITIDRYEFNLISEEAHIDGCRVDEERVDARGEYYRPNRRYDLAYNRAASTLVQRIRKAKFAQSWELLKYGAYTLYSEKNKILGVLDFKRDDALANIDLTGTENDWCASCAEPMQVVEEIVQNMARCNAAMGTVDIIHSNASWKAIQMHETLEAKLAQSPRQFSGFESLVNTNYAGVFFQGATNGGRFRHWTANGQYYSSNHELTDYVPEGHVLIAMRGSFRGLDLVSPWSKDYRERMPDNVEFFMNEEYHRKCRKTEQWIEHRHLMLPTNVNGAVLVKVVSDDCEFCKEC